MSFKGTSNSRTSNCDEQQSFNIDSYLSLYRYLHFTLTVYFHNQIIPIKFVTHLRNELITKEDNQIVVNDDLIDYYTEINSIRFGSSNYLGGRCYFSKDELYISPLIFIQSENELIADNYIVAKSLDFNVLHKYFEKSDSNIFISYKRWRSEYGNIEQTLNLRRGLWKHIETLKKENIFFWDGTVENKSQLVVPSSFESKVIYYESCRGLEAWSVACFSLDKFFSQKRQAPDAEKYLIGDLFLNQNNEQRKSMYAATWLLMTMTRVIDTLYIQIDDKDSEFGKLVEEYIQFGNKNTKKYL